MCSVPGLYEVCSMLAIYILTLNRVCSYILTTYNIQCILLPCHISCADSVDQDLRTTLATARSISVAPRTRCADAHVDLNFFCPHMTFTKQGHGGRHIFYSLQIQKEVYIHYFVVCFHKLICRRTYKCLISP